MKQISLSLLSALLLSSCTLGPDFLVPAPPAVTTYNSKTDAGPPDDQRIALGQRIQGDWWAGPEADTRDAGVGWRHACALHYKVRALHTELRAAEQDFGQDFTDGNFRRIVEIQRQLATTEGAEAAIEGFGGASGRTVRPF